MKPVLLTLALGLAMTGAPAFAQTPPAGQTPPAAPPQQPAAPAAPAAATPRPFPEGAKVAYLNIQRIASESAEGKAATTRVKALNDKKLQELQDRQKAIQASQQKLQTSGALLSDQARVQLEKEVERLQVDLQRATQDAQTEVQELQQELQLDFQKKLVPIINAVAAERGLFMVFSQADSGLVWADTGLDLTELVIKRFDTVLAPTAPKPQDE